MDTLSAPIFGDGNSELVCIQQPTPCIDLTDTALSPSIIPTIQGSPNLFISDPVSAHVYYDIQFNLANNYWGVGMNFGSDPSHSFCAANNASSTCAGLNIRQGIAHLLDKTVFTGNDQNIATISTPLDNPVPPDNGGLPTPNPCTWDISFIETGSNCAVGGSGGTAYHLAAATGANSIPWLYAPGSKDLDAAAYHLVVALSSLAGQTTVGCDNSIGAGSCLTSKDSRITGVNTAAAGYTIPNIFIRNDDPARLDLGNGLAAQLCYLFTGSYTNPCPLYLSTTHGNIVSFPGFVQTRGTVSLSWWLYTGAYAEVYPFDASLYFTYNSRFVNGNPTIQPPNGPCSASAVPTSTPANYVYLCNPAYDSISSQMEFAPCFSAAGDPAVGSMNNGPGADCTGTTQLSAISAGIQTEDSYGQGSFSIPVYDTTLRYAYLNNWHQVINADGVGIPNYFTWLDVYSGSPAVPGTVRQGLSKTTSSLNPYAAHTIQDFRLLGNVYDSLTVPNPLDPSQLLNWMTVSTRQFTNSQLTYLPPAGTTLSIRNTLRGDLFFQDGRRVTSFDVAYSYLSLKASGAFQSSGADPVVGITVLSPTQFDLNLNSIGPLTSSSLGSPMILPGRYWTSAGASAWDTSSDGCTGMQASTCFPAQYTIGSASAGAIPPILCALSCGFPAANLNVDANKVSPTFDPLASGVLIGSGPYECLSAAGVLGTGCSTSGTQTPPIGGSYTLTRFGKGVQPVSSLTGLYFRSSGNLALCIWSFRMDPCGGNFSSQFLDFTSVARCYQAPVGTLGCTRWQMGIGNPGGDGVTCCRVGIVQVSEAIRFVGVGWVSPFDWPTFPPRGIGSFPPVLHEGSVTLNPATVAGCASPFPAGGYDC
jgi:hypothetical protein